MIRFVILMFMARGPRELQQKILLLLLTGLALSFTRSPGRYYKIIHDAKKEWAKINSRSLKRAINSLYSSRLIEKKESKDGTITIILTAEGKTKALIYKLEEMEIKKPAKWDNKWRVVLFDIPENRRESRDILRFRLKRLGFYEFQKSVFVHPYDCKNEIDYLIEMYDIRRYVRFILANYLDNELHLK